MTDLSRIWKRAFENIQHTKIDLSRVWKRTFLSAGATAPSTPCASGDSRPSASTTNGTIGVAGDLACGYLERLERTMSDAAEPSVRARLAFSAALEAVRSEKPCHAVPPREQAEQMRKLGLPSRQLRCCGLLAELSGSTRSLALIRRRARDLDASAELELQLVAERLAPLLRARIAPQGEPPLRASCPELSVDRRHCA